MKNFAIAPADEVEFLRQRTLAAARGRGWVIDELITARFHPDWISTAWADDLRELADGVLRLADECATQRAEATRGNIGGAAAHASFAVDDWLVREWLAHENRLRACAGVLRRGATLEAAQ